MLCVDFIYLIPLAEWVPNLLLVDKKQGTIRISIYYHDLNAACPKDNYPTSSIDDCASFESFSFMDDFLGYNQIAIKLDDQHKIAFICSWGTFSYHKLPFGLKNVDDQAQWSFDTLIKALI